MDREAKIEVMNGIPNTVPVEIPVHEKRDTMIEKTTRLVEKKSLHLADKDMRAAESADQQTSREKLAMAKLGLTLHEDTFRGNEWYERAVECPTRNAHLVPEQSKKFMVVPEAGASGESWRVFHTVTHSCNPLSCTNTWHEVHDYQYSHLSVVLDTVHFPNSVSLHRRTDNLSSDILTAGTQSWGTLVSGTTTELHNYRHGANVCYPYESEGSWVVIGGIGVLEEDDVMYSTIRVTP